MLSLLFFITEPPRICLDVRVFCTKPRAKKRTVFTDKHHVAEQASQQVATPPPNEHPASFADDSPGVGVGLRASGVGRKVSGSAQCRAITLVGPHGGLQPFLENPTSQRNFTSRLFLAQFLSRYTQTYGVAKEL